jgi:hypothetical protein
MMNPQNLALSLRPRHLPAESPISSLRFSEETSVQRPEKVADVRRKRNHMNIGLCVQGEEFLLIVRSIFVHAQKFRKLRIVRDIPEVLAIWSENFAKV